MDKFWTGEDYESFVKFFDLMANTMHSCRKMVITNQLWEKFLESYTHEAKLKFRSTNVFQGIPVELIFLEKDWFCLDVVSCEYSIESKVHVLWQEREDKLLNDFKRKKK